MGFRVAIAPFLMLRSFDMIGVNGMRPLLAFGVTTDSLLEIGDGLPGGAMPFFDNDGIMYLQRWELLLPSLEM